ncbi:MAG: hypothetical protein ACE5F1_18295 [Planctomycetota bacterium]
MNASPGASSRALWMLGQALDPAVAVATDEEAEKIVFALQKEHRFSLLAVFEHAPSQKLGTARLGWPGSRALAPELDLLFASCGIEPVIVAAAMPGQIAPGLSIPVARLAHLVAMKLLAASDTRDQDRAGLRALLAIASEEELEQVRDAIRLIKKRGFRRDKDLEEDLARFQEQFQRIPGGSPRRV